MVVIGPVSKWRRAALCPILGDHLARKGALEGIRLLPERTSDHDGGEETLCE
jgi:hypothetical protein